MRRQLAVIAVVLGLLGGGTRLWAGVGSEAAQKLYEQVRPSLVAVQYTWDSEMGRREMIGSGIVIGEDGLVMTSISMFDLRIPDEQMKEFKIIVPTADGDEDELDAVFLGRDERSNVAFVKAAPQSTTSSSASPASTTQPHKWSAVKFTAAPVSVGDPVMSVGLLPKMAGYRPCFAEATVSAILRGEVPQILVSGGGLTSVGAPVFNASGQAIGLVNMQPDQTPFLNDTKNAMAAITNPPRFFVPATDFLASLEDLPAEGKPLKLPWIGLPQLAGLRKEVAEFFGLQGQPAVEVGDILANSPAERAGMKRGQIIVQVNGQPLERGDEPDEAAHILRRKLMRMKVGQQLTFSVLEQRGQPLKQISVALEERPRQQNQAARFFADDLGFTVREMVFTDWYLRRLPPDTKGVVIAWLKPQGSAQAGHLEYNDLVTEINNTPVTDLPQFRQAYEDFRKSHPTDAVVMVVRRDGSTEVIRIEPPQ